MPTVVDMVNKTKMVQVDDLFSATVDQMCVRAQGAAQTTFDSHVTVIRGDLPCEEPALRARLSAAQSEAAHAMDGLPLDGGYRARSLAQLDEYVAGIKEHVLLDNINASRAQCRGVWASFARRLDAQLVEFKTLEQLTAAVSAARLEVLPAMVGPHRDTVDMADEVSSWVQGAITSVGNRLCMEQAQMDAA
jgi:hypothetical protein